MPTASAKRVELGRQAEIVARLRQDLGPLPGGVIGELLLHRVERGAGARTWYLANSSRMPLM